MLKSLLCHVSWGPKHSIFTVPPPLRKRMGECAYVHIHGGLPLFCVNLELTNWMNWLVYMSRSRGHGCGPLGPCFTWVLGIQVFSLLSKPFIHHAVSWPWLYFLTAYKGHADCLTGATEACEGALFLVPEEHSYLVMCLSLHNPTVKHSVTSLTSPFSLSQSTE